MIVTLAQEAQANDAYLIWGFILVAVAVVLLFVELLVPSGGVIGMLSAVAVIGSMIAFFKYDTTWGIASALAYPVLAPIVQCRHAWPARSQQQTPQPPLKGRRRRRPAADPPRSAGTRARRR